MSIIARILPKTNESAACFIFMDNWAGAPLAFVTRPVVQWGTRQGQMNPLLVSQANNLEGYTSRSLALAIACRRHSLPVRGASALAEGSCVAGATYGSETSVWLHPLFEMEFESLFQKLTYYLLLIT